MLIVAFQMEQNQSPPFFPRGTSAVRPRAGLSGVLHAREDARTGGPPPDQPQEMDCDELNTERTRLLALRPDLNAPLLSSKTEAERDAELIQVNGKLYAIAKVQSDKRCPALATRLTGSVVR